MLILDGVEKPMNIDKKRWMKGISVGWSAAASIHEATPDSSTYGHNLYVPI
jgi:hypothetical protein